MTLHARTLKRFDPASARQPPREAEETPHPPPDRDIVLIGAGNSGEAVTLRCQALAYNDGVGFTAAGLNNDRLPPRAVLARRPSGAIAPLELLDRLVLDGENPRDRLHEHPVLEQRYQRLLRGLSVFETYPRAGAGVHGHPVIAALDLDLHIDLVLGGLRRALRPLRDESTSTAGQSDLRRLLAQQRRRSETPREKRIVVIGGGAGSMGNAAHQILPYLIRWLLAELGITAYELWGVVLGPRAFTGLTPFVRQNHRALLEALDELSRHGLRRAFLNDLEITLRQPPYDRVFLLDDPALPGAGARVTEAEIEAFLDQTALSLYLLLRGMVWQTVASHTANDDGVARADGRLCYLHTVRAALIGADREQIADLLAASLSARLLERFIERFEGSEGADHAITDRAR